MLRNVMRLEASAHIQTTHFLALLSQGFWFIIELLLPDMSNEF